MTGLSLGLWACGKKSPPSCLPKTGLSEREQLLRTQLAYAEPSPTVQKLCIDCTYFVPQNDGACGACSTVPGPIHPQGTCLLFRSKI